MNNLSLKTSMIGAFALMLTIAGVITPLSAFATVTPPAETMITIPAVSTQGDVIESSAMTISTELINLIAAWDLEFPVVHKYCPIPTSINRNYVGDWEQGIDIQCTKSYYQKLMTATNTKVENTLRNYENKYPVLEKRLQVIENAIHYAEKQRNNTKNSKKKFVYDLLRIKLYGYVLSLDDGDLPDTQINDMICNVFEGDNLCHEDMIIETNTTSTMIKRNVWYITSVYSIGSKNYITIDYISYGTCLPDMSNCLSGAAPIINSNPLIRTFEIDANAQISVLTRTWEGTNIENNTISLNDFKRRVNDPYNWNLYYGMWWAGNSLVNISHDDNKVYSISEEYRP